jgi:sensor histidine kinase regulating citrate/malate metabolism
VSELGLVSPLERTLVEGTPRQDELHVTSARVLVLNQARAQWQGRDLGTVVTLRDRTDLQALTGELDTARGLTEALRSQAHESANRLHTVVSLIELDRAQDALEFATEELSLAQRLTDEVVGAVDEPALTALLLGKSAQASERGIDFVVGDHVVVPDGVAPSRDLVTIVGNLVDNAFDACDKDDPWVEVTVQQDDAALRIVVADSGSGMDEATFEQARRRGYSTKEGGAEGRRGLGLALVSQVVERHGGRLTAEVTYGSVVSVTIEWGAALRRRS